jgi:hypothetical protein
MFLNIQLQLDVDGKDKWASQTPYRAKEASDRMREVNG